MRSLILCLVFSTFANGHLFASENNEETAESQAETTSNKKTTGAITGVIRDRKTGETLAGVNIIVAGTQLGAASDPDGNFQIRHLTPGTYTLMFSFIGYARTKINDLAVRAGEINDIGTIALKEEALTLETLVVTPGQFSIMGTAPLSRQTLSSQDIQNMSWAEDITRAVARLPGISSSDYSSKFTIRGGESDEVLITLDGMELYEPFHQRDYSGGLFSIVDIETIQGIELNTGGFSAEYGNRLSGVFSMRTKKPQEGQRHTSIGLSIMNARLYSDGTFAGGKGSYIFSARRGMLDLLFKVAPFAETATLDQSATPKFYDMMAKIEYKLAAKHLVSMHALHAGDQNGIEDVSDDGNFDRNNTQYGNTYGWLTLNSNYSADLSSRSILYGGYITHDRRGSFHKYEPSDKGDFLLRDQRDFSLFGLKHDWNWNVTDRLFVSGGFEAKQLRANYKYFGQLEEVRVNTAEELYSYNSTRDVSTSPSGLQLGLYLTNRFKILPKLVAEVGLRYDHSSYSKDNLWSPRAGLAFALAKNTFLRGAWGYYYQTQFLNNLDINHSNIIFDPAEMARHYVLGFEHLFANGINLRLEGYYKDLSNYSPQWQNLRDHLEIFPEARNDNARVDLNGTTSKGLELFMKYDKGGKISWWFSYALAKAEDDVATIEYDGLLIKKTGSVSRLNDQRHTIYADLNYRPNHKWHYSLSWQYYRGWPRTDYTYRYQTLPNGDLHFYPVHLEFNGAIYPAYHRLDLRINQRFDTRAGQLTVFLHLINLYNRQNLKKLDLDTRDDEGNYSLDAQGNYVPFHDDKYWFGLIPVIGTSWEF